MFEPLAPAHELKPIPGWPDYFACSDGTIYSQRAIHNATSKVLKAMKPVLRSKYWYVTVSNGEQRKSVGIHRLVAFAFLPPPAVIDGELQSQVCHIDNNLANNAAANLRWGTPKQNLADRIPAGTMTWGERNGQTKITAETVAEIRRRRCSKERCVDIAADLKLSPQQVHRIGRGERWAHIGVPVAPRQRKAFKRKETTSC